MSADPRLLRLTNVAASLYANRRERAAALRAVASAVEGELAPEVDAGAQLGRDLEARGHLVIAGRVRTLAAANALNVPPATLRTWRARQQGPASERDATGEHWYALAELVKHLKRTRFKSSDVGVLQSEPR